MAVKLKGIDISAYQRGIPFDKIKAAGVDFVIIRAGCAKNKDSQLDAFVKECEKYGIKYGFYWYSYALTVDRAKEEAEKCLETIKNYKPDYPIYFDIEDKSQIGQLTTRTRTDMVIAFCEKIRAAGYTPGIYANPSWFTSYLYKNELINEYEVWLAHWTENPNIPTGYNYGQRVWQWGLDQISDFNVDGDLSFHDYNLSGNQPVIEEETPAVEIPVTIEINDIVYFPGGSHYVSSTSDTAVGGHRTAGLARVMNINSNGKHKYALRGIEGGSDVFGWVDEVNSVEEKKDEIALGDKVRVKNGSKDYKGRGLASFVYNLTYVVMQTYCGVAADYIVIGNGTTITAAVHAADLIKQ